MVTRISVIQNPGFLPDPGSRSKFNHPTYPQNFRKIRP